MSLGANSSNWQCEHVGDGDHYPKSRGKDIVTMIYKKGKYATASYQFRGATTG